MTVYALRVAAAYFRIPAIFAHQLAATMLTTQGKAVYQGEVSEPFTRSKMKQGGVDSTWIWNLVARYLLRRLQEILDGRTIRGLATVLWPIPSRDLGG